MAWKVQRGRVLKRKVKLVYSSLESKIFSVMFLP